MTGIQPRRMEIISNYTSAGSFSLSISSEKFSNPNDLLRFYLYWIKHIDKNLKALHSACFEAKNDMFKDGN
jgi:hypothetical protein